MSLSTHESKVAVFLIESGRALELAQQWMQEEHAQRRQAREIGQELGVSRVYLSFDTGVVLGVYFGDKLAVHPDFRKPNRKGASFPKKHSGWAVRLAQQHERKLTMAQVNKELGIPDSLCVRHAADGSEIWRMLSSPVNPSGFLSLSDQGPFAIWTPDVDDAIRQEREAGNEVLTFPKDFKFIIAGTRRILPEQWDLMVAEHRLAKAAQAAA